MNIPLIESDPAPADGGRPRSANRRKVSSLTFPKPRPSRPRARWPHTLAGSPRGRANPPRAEDRYMVGVIVTFRYGADFDAAKVRKVADGARGRFEGMPGLRSKVFTLNPAAREATNFYVWDAESAAKQFFT